MLVKQSFQGIISALIKTSYTGKLRFCIANTKSEYKGTVFVKYGKIHRVGGPAVIYQDGCTTWWKHGELHREDGPAIENYFDDEISKYWLDGEPFSERRYKLKVRQLKLNKFFDEA